VLGDIREREEPLFGCIIEPGGEMVHVRVTGELDLATAPVLETALADLREAGFAQVVLDLRQLTFIACAGIHILLTQDAALLACGGRLRIVVAPGFVDQVFDLGGGGGGRPLAGGTAGPRSPAGDAAERS
jgi:anti-anti-sigma factor